MYEQIIKGNLIYLFYQKNNIKMNQIYFYKYLLFDNKLLPLSGCITISNGVLIGEVSEFLFLIKGHK